jgi:hypothetical protein
MASYGRCEASLRNGQPCRVVIETEGAEFCPHHLRLAKEYGAEIVRKGAVPKRRARSVTKASSPIRTTGPEVTTPAVAPAKVPAVGCPCCSARSRVEESVGEVSARLAAIELLLREALGRLPQVDETLPAANALTQS